MKRKKRILVAPLDWGLGHATRCVPIIEHIMASGHEVILAADGRAFNLLSDEFPALKIVKLAGYHPVYPGKDAMVFTMFLQTPRFLKVIFQEHQKLKTIINVHKIDAVISDNRYGLWSDKVPCVLLTHQVHIKMPSGAKVMERPVNRLNHFFMSKYKECWVPDAEGVKSLSGALSFGQNMHRNLKHIGILSRFEKTEAETKNDILVILSGPEPQRSVFEGIVVNQLKQIGRPAIIVRGITERKEDVSNGNIRMVSSFNAKELNEIILQSKIVVARAGYSNIMDLVTLRRSAILVPTPGQTEQEYLAKTLSEKNYFFSQTQEKFNLNLALKEVEKCEIPCSHIFDKNYFKKVVDEFLIQL